MNQNAGPAEKRYRVVYDPVLKRPGCVLLAAALGGDYHTANRFRTEDWLLAPTPDMGVFVVTADQLNQLVKITEANR